MMFFAGMHHPSKAKYLVLRSAIRRSGRELLARSARLCAAGGIDASARVVAMNRGDWIIVAVILTILVCTAYFVEYGG